MSLDASQILWLVALVMSAGWVVVGWKAHAAAGRMRSIDPASEADLDAGGASLAVIVPARDEERSVEPALRSVLGQRGVDLHVVAVDDHSRDATGTILDSLAEERRSLTVLHAPQLVEGWTGKANALRCGSEHAGDTDYLLFTDADIVHRPGCFAAAVGAMGREGLDLLTIIPSLEWCGAWENSMAPVVPFLLLAACRPEFEDPSSPRAFGIGAFLLVRASKYEQLGGHEPIKADAVDDVALARRFKSGGGRVAVRLGPACVALRMFQGTRGITSHLSRNFSKMLLGRPMMALPVGLTIVFLFGGAVLLVAGGAAAGRLDLVAAGLLWYAAPYAVALSFARVSRARPLSLVLYPLGALPLLAALAAGLRSALKGEIAWRGRAAPEPDRESA